jgi:Outer membrane efflux protein
MKKILFSIFIILSFSTTYAQKISTKDILTTALTDERLQYNQQLATYAQGLKFHVPLVKQIEARIGFNGSALSDTLYGYLRNEDYYGLQIGLNSLREIKQQKRVKIAQISVYQSQNRVFQQQALVERYQSLVAVRFIQNAIAERQKLDTLLGKKHEILRVMMERNVDFKVKDVMDTEGDKNTVQLALLDLENDRRFHQSKLQQFIQNKTVTELDLSDFITVEKIAQVVESQRNTPFQFPAIDYKNAQTQYSGSKLDYINSQNRQIFSMARIGFENPLYLELQPPKRFNTLNNFSLRVGLNVPLIGNNNFKRSESLLELKEAQNDADWVRQQNQKSVDIQYLKLENLLKQHRFYKEKTEQNLVKKMLKNDKLLAQITPLELVDMQLTQQKLEIRTLEIVQEITTEYVKLLELTGLISTTPLKNYLSQGLEGF